MNIIFDVLCDTFIDALRLLPFLFLAYLAMEFLEHWTGGKMQEVVKKSGKAGPAIGSLLGVFPQCGFSAAAANLYAGRIITMGTLIAVFLSTSDEMLPIMISENVPLPMMGKILFLKMIFALAAGFLVDFFFRKSTQMQISHLCERQHCHCERGIWRSAFHHTWKIFLYIAGVSLILNFAIALIGEETLAALVQGRPALSLFLAALVGMIPNCASSVILTQLYLSGVVNAGALMAGLLSGSGVGFLVLIRVNEDRKENLRIFALLYAIGVGVGALIQILGVTF